jgi:uncharacterized protein YkwD
MKRALLATAIVLLASPLAHSDIEVTKATLREYALKLINRDRQLHGLPPVSLDLEVSAFGDRYCDAQIRNRTTGHFTTDGMPPYMRYSLAGGDHGLTENAAGWSADYSFSEKALYEMTRRSQDAMMAELPPDDGHRRAILDPNATHVGIGMAWEKGEFRLVHEFVRKYIDWTRPFPRSARIGEPVMGGGRTAPGTSVFVITVHHEPFPEPMPSHVASAIDIYGLPTKRREYLPRLVSEYLPNGDGTMKIVKREYVDGSRGDFYRGEDGTFNFTVPLIDGPGIYTVVVWVKKDGVDRPFSASNVSIRVEDFLMAGVGADSAGR